MMDWKDIGYLRNGNTRQQHAYAVLTGHRVLHTLAGFDPILVGTVPIGIDVVGSDLDIICHSADLDAFIACAQKNWGTLIDFTARLVSVRGIHCAVVNLTLDGLPIELFAQDLATIQQHAYRHMVIEERILHERGEGFRSQVIALKERGVATEPAFARLLGLKGDPYLAVLELEGTWPSFPDL